MKISPACEAFGCFVEDLDLASAADQEIAALRDLLFENGALYFRNQQLTPPQQIAFARQMGEIVVNRFFVPYPGYPEIAQVLTEADQGWVIGENWHTDHSYDQAPALGSILYAEEVPPSGGDTCFAGMQAAYDALDNDMKARLEGMKALHESIQVFAPSEATRLKEARERGDSAYLERAAAYPEAIHPVVLAHPETGRKGLYINPEFTTGIVDMPEAESEQLLKHLYDHILQPQFLFRFQWEPGSIAIWDNRSTWHKAMNDYFGHRRLMRRITLDGVPLENGTRIAA